MKVLNRPTESDQFSVDQFYREKYPFMFENTRPYKYRVTLKEPLMYINVGPSHSKSVENEESQTLFDDSDFK